MATGKEIATDALRDSRGLLGEWLTEMRAAGVMGDGRMTEAEVTAQCEELLGLLAKVVSIGSEVTRKEWDETRVFLEALSRSRATHRRPPLSAFIGESWWR